MLRQNKRAKRAISFSERRLTTFPTSPQEKTSHAYDDDSLVDLSLHWRSDILVGEGDPVLYLLLWKLHDGSGSFCDSTIWSITPRPLQ